MDRPPISEVEPSYSVARILQLFKIIGKGDCKGGKRLGSKYCAATRRLRRGGETIKEQPRPVMLRFGLYSVREGSCFECQIASH